MPTVEYADDVEYTRLGSTGLEVSRLCLGCMNFGSSREWMVDDHDRARELITTAVDRGINFLDTANVYSRGESERIVGSAIEGYRDEVVLATKVRGRMAERPNGEELSKKHVIEQCHASLDRLGTDYVDLYQIHRWHDETPIEETLSAIVGPKTHEQLEDNLGAFDVDLSGEEIERLEEPIDPTWPKG